MKPLHLAWAEEGSDEWRVRGCQWGQACDEREKLNAPGSEIVEAWGIASIYQGDSARDVSTGPQAFVFLLVWGRVGVRQVAGAAATAVVVEYVSAPTAAFAAGEPVLTFVVSVHLPVVGGCAGDLAPVWSGVFGAH